MCISWTNKGFKTKIVLCKICNAFIKYHHKHFTCQLRWTISPITIQFNLINITVATLLFSEIITLIRAADVWPIYRGTKVLNLIIMTPLFFHLQFHSHQAGVSEEVGFAVSILYVFYRVSSRCSNWNSSKSVGGTRCWEVNI